MSHFDFLSVDEFQLQDDVVNIVRSAQYTMNGHLFA